MRPKLAEIRMAEAMKLGCQMTLQFIAVLGFSKREWNKIDQIVSWVFKAIIEVSMYKKK